VRSPPFRAQRQRSWSTGFEVSVDGVAHNVADPAVPRPRDTGRLVHQSICRPDDWSPFGADEDAGMRIDARPARTRQAPQPRGDAQEIAQPPEQSADHVSISSAGLVPRPRRCRPVAVLGRSIVDHAHRAYAAFLDRPGDQAGAAALTTGVVAPRLRHYRSDVEHYRSDVQAACAERRAERRLGHEQERSAGQRRWVRPAGIEPATKCLEGTCSIR
jgi:hypothetical protein